MRIKTIIYRIWKTFPAYMLGVLLIFSNNIQVVNAIEENQEVIEKEQIQEESEEISESTQEAQEENAEAEESTQIIPEETSEIPESTETAPKEMPQAEESSQTVSEETQETEENTQTSSEENSQEKGTQETQEQTETSDEQVKPKELDLGDYLTEMTVGDKQLLMVTILPVNTSVTELIYKSSNKEIATINGMGRITALKEGKTIITVTCADVSQSFELTVNKPENTDIKVTELDLGDCPKEITIGTSQLLSVAVIPADATDTEFKYESNNPNVASVNALGRLTGKSLGTAEITVSCGDVRQKFQVTVVKDETKEKIEVTDIEISDYKDELNVDSTVNLSVTVLPKDATDAEVTYKSSDVNIATVNSSGEIKGIAPGDVIIYVMAGNVTKQAQFKVKTGTKAIELNSDYEIMKPNDTFQITAQVFPVDAPNELTYKSMDTSVAEVSSGGVITAKGCGDTTISVSNGDLQVSVNIIVNEDSVSAEQNEKSDKTDQKHEMSFLDDISTKEYPVITTEMLKYFYEKEKVLTVRGEDYIIYLDGKDIVNFENELETKLLVEQADNGFILAVNDEKKLCGKITIDISDKITDEKYLYIYNEEKERYQSLKTDDISLLHIDTAGKYLITAKKVMGFEINVILIITGCVAVVVGVAVYIGVKRKYWFW